MRYKFVKTIYEKCNYGENDYMKTKAFKAQVAQIVKKLSDLKFCEITNIGRCTKKMYDDILIDLDFIKDNCIDAETREFLSEDHKTVRGFFEKEVDSQVGFPTAVAIAECRLLFYVITETQLYQDNKEVCHTYEELYEDIMESGGHLYKSEVCSYMEDYILLYVFRTSQSLDIYQQLLESWSGYYNRVERTCSTNQLVLPYLDERKKLTFREWKEIIDAGTEEADNERKTKKSIGLIQANLDEIVEDSEKIGKTTVEEIFSQEIIVSVENAEKRRTWYLFRILSKIIEYQIDKILAAVKVYNEKIDQNMLVSEKKALEKKKREEEKSKKEIKENKEPKNKEPIRAEQEAVQAAISNCLLNIRINGLTGGKIGQRPILIKGLDREDLKKALWDSLVSREKIGTMFDGCFDGVFRNWNDDDAEIGGRDSGFRQRNLGCAFATYKSRDKVYNSDAVKEYFDMESLYRSASSRFKGVLFKGKPVSRELLLAAVLVSRVMGVEVLDEYVKMHILYNSRFIREFNEENNAFDRFYTEASRAISEVHQDPEERIECLKEQSAKIEEYYMERYKKAFFNEILLGKKVLQ